MSVKTLRRERKCLGLCLDCGDDAEVKLTGGKYVRCRRCRKSARESWKQFYIRARDRRREKSRREQRVNVERGRSAYNGLRQRCENPKNADYRYYGARGVTCSLTEDRFREIYFGQDNCSTCGQVLDDLNRRSGCASRTIDRIDSQRGYEEGNLRVVCRSCNSRLARAGIGVAKVSRRL